MQQREKQSAESEEVTVTHVVLLQERRGNLRLARRRASLALEQSQPAPPRWASNLKLDI